MKLNAIEARVIAALVEKDRTTPDSYPLTTNSLVAACNQKTSREPVMALNPAEVDAALLELRQRHMARTVRGTGERTFKHLHTLDSALELDAGELALVAVLMLRGPQTPGELRTRTERYTSFDDVDSVEVVLHRLAGRDEPLVRNLGRGPGQSQDRWVELVSEVGDDRTGPAVDAGDSASVPAAPAVVPDRREDDLEALRSEVEELRRLVEEIRSELGMAEPSGPDGPTP